MTKSWGYSGHVCGPSEWPKKFPTGNRQSPINISTHLDVRSTCCQHGNGNIQQHQIAAAEAERDLTSRELGEQLRSSVHVRDFSEVDSADETLVGKQVAKPARLAKHTRAHLDSGVGELDFESSSSSGYSHGRNSSGGSSASSSPAFGEPQQNTSNSDNGSRQGKQIYQQHHNNDDNNNNIKDEQQLQQQHRQHRHHQDQQKQYHHNQNRSKLGQNTRHCVSKRKIFLGYPRYLENIEISNTGHNWQVDIPPEIGLNTLLAGPPFGDREFRLAQFHCHWGPSDRCGSEHQINGQAYAAEIHFVHWNCTDFSSFQEAATQRHGLAVLAVLVQAIEGEQNRNKHLDKICHSLDKVRAPETSHKCRARLDPKKLFPDNRWTYATYEGSLTTPPLSEVVDWLVFLKPILCSSSQIDQFRRLECHSQMSKTSLAEPLLGNCRPVQPHCDRLVTLWSHH